MLSFKKLFEVLLSLIELLYVVIIFNRPLFWVKQYQKFVYQAHAGGCGRSAEPEVILECPGSVNHSPYTCRRIECHYLRRASEFRMALSQYLYGAPDGAGYDSTD